jgi:FtsP/CotA-like multicopper oxidase with cupredoxin domain
MTKHNKLLIVTVALGVAVIAAIFWLTGTLNRHSSTMESSDTTKYLQSMMGVDKQEKLPIKKVSDAKEFLEPIVTSDGVKEFTLTAEPVRWEYASGKTILAWGYNGQVPGPQIRVIEGDKVRIKFTNKLPKETTVHWHGLNVPSNMDGVPGVSQDAIKAGESFTYEFTALPAGTHFYHTHGSGHEDEAQQSDMGLSGALVVEPRGYQKPDKEYTLVLDDWQKGSNGFNQAAQDMNMENHSMNMNYNLFTINGLAFPDTKPINVKQGDKVRIRLINASASTFHPMHLHGQQFTVVAQDGNELPPVQQYVRNTIVLHPGETYDIEVTANNPGVWAFHCHELHHAGSGMVTLFKYDGYAPTATTNETKTEEMQMDDQSMDHSMHSM